MSYWPSFHLQAIAAYIHLYTAQAHPLCGVSGKFSTGVVPGISPLPRTLPRGTSSRQARQRCAGSTGHAPTHPPTPLWDEPCLCLLTPWSPGSAGAGAVGRAAAAAAAAAAGRAAPHHPAACRSTHCWRRRCHSHRPAKPAKEVRRHSNNATLTCTNNNKQKRAPQYKY